MLCKRQLASIWRPWHVQFRTNSSMLLGNSEFRLSFTGSRQNQTKGINSLLGVNSPLPGGDSPLLGPVLRYFLRYWGRFSATFSASFADFWISVCFHGFQIFLLRSLEKMCFEQKRKETININTKGGLMYLWLVPPLMTCSGRWKGRVLAAPQALQQGGMSLLWGRMVSAIHAARCDSLSFVYVAKRGKSM